MTSVQNHSDADTTRLMCAGTYCDPNFRKGVIRELKTNWYRKVAPAYGYDAVPVLAHALAAQQLRSTQIALTAVGSFSVLLLWLADVFGFLDLLLFLAFVAWTFSFLRRLVMLETLATKLKSGKFNGAFPWTSGMSDDLIDRISREQAVGAEIYYGGYKPFVGAGIDIRDWSNAQLLVPARVDPLSAAIRGRDGYGTPGSTVDGRGLDRIIGFTVGDITSFVERRLVAALRDEAGEGREVKGLTIERPRYRKVVGISEKHEQGPAGLEEIHWREEYDAAREYLCVRVGSWNQELVTSIFVGFDLKGSTLHTEFHTYVLGPINASYHLVDRLPDELGGNVVARAAWDALKAVVGDVFEPFAVAFGYLADRLTRRGGREPADAELNLPAYVVPVADRGAVTSVRELAASSAYHHYFQKTDASKYMKIVERRLLESIETFLRDHNVDLADHAVFQSTILGDVITHHGAGHISSRNTGTQTQGDHSPIRHRVEKARDK